ncbi:hypothetical protein [Ancylobacter terrae]|uniref:hypothetical protein n=1 Tax=Ancylobacter sp. sgz301288 TaxID=3342077 RepID=UPI00385AF8C2
MDDAVAIVLRLLLRLVVVPFGYLAGMSASMLVIIIGYWRLGDLLAGVTEVELFAILDALVTATWALTIVVFVMWAVATIGILFAEAFAIRSWIYHTANGAISAWLGAQVVAPYADAPVPFDDLFYILAAGLAGGLAYWAVAGWSAGFWLPVGGERGSPKTPPPQAPPLPQRPGAPPIESVPPPARGHD